MYVHPIFRIPGLEPCMLRKPVLCISCSMLWRLWWSFTYSTIVEDHRQLWLCKRYIHWYIFLITSMVFERSFYLYLYYVILYTETLVVWSAHNSTTTLEGGIVRSGTLTHAHHISVDYFWIYWNNKVYSHGYDGVNMVHHNEASMDMFQTPFLP